MKQLFTLIVLIALALPASGQTIKRQFGTTNDPTTLTNIIFDIAAQVGGATNGIEKLNGFGTNTTFYKGATANITLVEPPGDNASISIGNNISIDADEGSFSVSDSAGPAVLFSVLGDVFHVPEVLLVTEELQVSTGQEGAAIMQTGGGTNFLDASTRFESNVFARTFVADIGITNNALTASRPVFTDANKALVSTTIDLIPGSNVTITTNAANRAWTIASTGGGSGDTNGISYSLDGGGIGPAIRTILDGTDEILEFLYPDGVTAGGITNDILVLQSHAGYGTAHIIMGTESVLGGSDVYMKEGGRAAFRATANSRQIMTGDGLSVASEWNTYDAPVLGSYTYKHAEMDDGGFLQRVGTEIKASTNASIDTINVTTLNIGNISVTNRLTVTNSFRQPFFELVSTGNATNYTVDWAATVPDNNIINATGNVYFASIAANLVGGVTKQYVITNVFWGSSNTTVYVQTNLMHLHGQTYTVGASPMHTNYAIPNTNFVVLNLQSVGSTPQSIMSFFVHNQP